MADVFLYIETVTIDGKGLKRLKGLKGLKRLKGQKTII